jgi:hypothetical protein
MPTATEKRRTCPKLSLRNRFRKSVLTTVLVTVLFLVIPKIYVEASNPTVSVQPLSQTVWGIGESVTINIEVEGVADLYGWELKLYYDRSILNGTGAVEGSFLNANGATYFHYTFADTYNSTHGQLAAFNSLLGNVSGVSGSGILVTITFQTKGLGSCLFNLRDTKLGDVDSTLLPHDTVDGSVQVVKTVHDVAVNTVSVSSNEAVEGQIIYIFVVVANYGNKTETFNVATYRNETVIDTRTAANLTSKTQTILTYNWNTSGVTTGDSYTIKAEALPVPGETNLANNILINGVVTIVAGIHNIAILSVTPSAYEVYEGSIVSLKVQAANNGNYSETFQVAAYYNETVIDTKTVSLVYDSTQYITFAWDTTGVEVNSTYIIKAVASIVTEEINPTDNTFVDGTVTVYPRTLLSIDITSVTPSNQFGEPLSHFQAGTTAYFEVSVVSNSVTAETILVTVNVHDSHANTIGVASFKGPLASGVTTFMIGFPIPNNVEFGDAVVYVNALTDWPHLGGVPLCPEKTATFEITGP